MTLGLTFLPESEPCRARPVSHAISPFSCGSSPMVAMMETLREGKEAPSASVVGFWMRSSSLLDLDDMIFDSYFFFLCALVLMGNLAGVTCSCLLSRYHRLVCMQTRCLAHPHVPISFRVQLALAFLVPESPRWLVKHGRIAEAKALLRVLHGVDVGEEREAEIERELEGMQGCKYDEQKGSASWGEVRVDSCCPLLVLRSSSCDWRTDRVSCCSKYPRGDLLTPTRFPFLSLATPGYSFFVFLRFGL